jgi:hypothetical protein
MSAFCSAGTPGKTDSSLRRTSAVAAKWELIGNVPGREGLPDRQSPVAVELVCQLIAKSNQGLGSALTDQGSMECSMEPLPLRIVLKPLGAERPWGSAEPVMSHDEGFLPFGSRGCHGLAQRQTLDPASCLGQLCKFRLADPSDIEATLLPRLHEPLGGEPIERLPERCLAGLVGIHQEPHLELPPRLKVPG